MSGLDFACEQNDLHFHILSMIDDTLSLDATRILNCLSDKYPRIAIFARQGGQVWNDQQVVVDDSFERCSGYQYFGIIDHDEFFIPSKNRTLLETLVSENIRGIHTHYKRRNVKRKKELIFKHVRPAKIQTNLHIRVVLSEFS